MHVPHTFHVIEILNFASKTCPNHNNCSNHGNGPASSFPPTCLLLQQVPRTEICVAPTLIFWLRTAPFYLDDTENEHSYSESKQAEHNLHLRSRLRFALSTCLPKKKKMNRTALNIMSASRRHKHSIW